MKKNVLLMAMLLATTAGIGTAKAEKLGEHPAVIVARTWNARGVDPNTFIVAHPARLALVATSPSAKEQGTEIQAAAATPVSAAAGK